MFYIYRQNNSGGYFDNNEKVGQYVIIERDSGFIADEFFETLVEDQSPSCPCCGWRWESTFDDELKFPITKAPYIYTHHKDYENKWKLKYGEFEITEQPSVVEVFGTKQYRGIVNLNTVEDYAQYLVNNGSFNPSVIIYYSNGDKKIISATTVN